MFLDCRRVDVNTECISEPTTISVDGISPYVCPAYVDKRNWLTVGEDHVDDAFEVNQDGDSLTVTRADGWGNGWCIALSFECCQGMIFIVTLLIIKHNLEIILLSPFPKY